MPADRLTPAHAHDRRVRRTERDLGWRPFTTEYGTFMDRIRAPDPDDAEDRGRFS